MSDTNPAQDKKNILRILADFLKSPFTAFGSIWASPVPALGGFLAAVVLGWCVELVFGLCSQPTRLDGVRAFCILWFSSGAAFFIGAIAGFLFGVPKAIRDPGARTSDRAEGGQYRDNTNLEEVSDWITKILVGLGIAQFGEIVRILGDIGEVVGSSIGGANGAKEIAISSMLYGFICGFLWYYVWTRYTLRNQFESQKKGETQTKVLLSNPDQNN